MIQGSNQIRMLFLAPPPPSGHASPASPWRRTGTLTATSCIPELRLYGNGCHGPSRLAALSDPQATLLENKAAAN